MGQGDTRSESVNRKKQHCYGNPNWRGKLPRRDFLKIAGVGMLAYTPVHTARSILASWLAQTADIQHFVPADKKLSREWLRSLYSKGATAVYRGKELATIGMPIGGIGAGQLYLCGDGTLGCWQLFNGDDTGDTGETSDQSRIPAKPLQQGFAVVIQTDGKTAVRKLSNEGFTDIEFTGEYPIGNVNYSAPSCPVRVRMEAFSPFIPLNARDSGLPATLFHLTLENVSRQPVRVGVLGWLENAICFHTANRAQGLRRSHIVQEKNRTLIVHSAEAEPTAASAPASHPSSGPVDESRDTAVGPIDTLHDFGTMVLMCGEQAAPSEDVTQLLASAGGLDVPFSLEADGRFPIHQKRTTALGTPMVEIAPDAQHTVSFVLAWHFPNRRHAGQVVGQAYAAWLPNASTVAHYVLDNHDRLAGDTRKWHDTYYDSTLPHWLLDRLFFPVANLATSTTQWWQNGQFWAGGSACCPEGTCTHVWNYAHAAARLFPQLERSVRHMQDLGEAFHEDGLVGSTGQRNNAYAADGQAGTVLKCYREHLCSPDGEFLKNHWPRIKQALLLSISHDANDDGLIEDSQPNTYDVNFEGPNTFVGSLYLAALKAGEAMAREMNDTEFADRCHQIYEAGGQHSVDRLWNGEYFIQQVDLQKYPKHQYGPGCLSDQVFGQGWAHQVALGYIYPSDHVKRALQSVWKYNWAPDVGPQTDAHKPARYFATAGEAGLLTCTWPHSKHLDEGIRHQNEVWTGIEYQVAGHMIWERLLDEALGILRGVHDRYHPSKRNPYNEVECSNHDARALASWSVFTALSGFEYHGPRGQMSFSPRITPRDFRTAFTTAQGWGTFSQKRENNTQRNILSLAWGQLRLTSLALQLPKGISASRAKLVALYNGQPIDPDRTAQGRRLTLRFKAPLQLVAGQNIDITVTG